MSGFLIDSNVLLDIATNDPAWADWSADQLSACACHGALTINPIIYAEVSVGFRSIEEVENFLIPRYFCVIHCRMMPDFLQARLSLLIAVEAARKHTA